MNHLAHPTSWQTTAPAHNILAAAAQAAENEIKKATIATDGNTLTITRKQLWQTQTLRIVAAGDEVTITPDGLDGTSMITARIFAAIQPLLDTRGWNEALAATGTRALSERDLYDLASLLQPGERFTAITRGLSVKKKIILIATDRRVLLTEAKAIGWETTARTIPLEKISSITVDGGLAFSKVTITTSNEAITIKDLPNEEANGFAHTVQDQLAEPAVVSNSAAQTDGLPDRLQQLAELHDAGVLTDEEFAAAKAKALGL